MPNPSILEREDDNLHPRERIVQEYRRVTPVHSCPAVLPLDGQNPLWVEVQELTSRVKALEAERDDLARQLAGTDWRTCPSCKHSWPHPSVTSSLICPSCYYGARIKQLESDLADAHQFIATWKAEASEQRQLAQQLKEENASGAALRQVFYDATQEAFIIGQQLHNRATKAEMLFMIVWEKLYNAVRDHDTGLRFVQGVQITTEQLEAERDSLAVEFARLRREAAATLPTAEASDLRQLAARASQ